MRLSADRSGRVPFSFAAVLILAGSIFAGAYMEEVSDRRLEAGREGSARDIEAQLSNIRIDLMKTARNCIGLAVDARLGMGAASGSQAMWSLDMAFDQLFRKAVSDNYAGRALGDLIVDAAVVDVNLSAQPVFFRTMNRFGMMVNTTGAGALRAFGSVNLTFHIRGGPAQTRMVPIDVREASWYPFALSQAVRMRRDCASEGLVELLVREQLSGYLERSIPLILMVSYSTPMPGMTNLWDGCDFTPVCEQAVSNALVMEEEILFMRATSSKLSDHFSFNGGGHFRVASALLSFASENEPPAWTDVPREGDISIEIPERGESVHLYDNLNRSGLSAVALYPRSGWLAGPSLTVTNRIFAGEELKVDVYSLDVQVHGTYSLVLSPDEKGAKGISFDIPVNLDFLVDGRCETPPFNLYESGGKHCQMENLSMFDSDFARLYRAPVDLTLQLQDSSGAGVRSISRPFSVELSVDNEPVGIFGRQDLSPAGLSIPNLWAGPHTFAVALTYFDTGEVEYGMGAGTFEGAAGDLTIRTDSGPDTARFWSTVLSYIRDVPYDLRMAKMLELFSKMTGFPMPDDVAGMSNSSPSGVQRLMTWGQRFHRYLVSDDLSAASEASRGAYREAMVSAVEIALEVTARIEGLLASLEWDRAARTLAISAINITVKGFMDPGKRTSILAIDFESGFSKATLRFGKAADGKNRWSLEMPQQEDFEWTFDPLSKKEKVTLAFEGAVDVLFIVSAASSMWTKYQKYESSDGGLTQYETLDLSIDIAQICMGIANLVIRTVAKGLFQDVGDAAGKTLKVAGEFVNFVAGFLQMFQMVNDELEHFEGDEAAWASLFSVIDETTITFYFTLASTIVSFVAVLAAMGAAWGGGLAMLAFLAPFLGPLGAILALATLIIMIIYNSEAIGCFFAGTSTVDARDKTISSVGATLRGTVGTIASLNEYGADKMMLEARGTRGAACLLDGIGIFIDDGPCSFELANISSFSYDTAWAREHQAVSARSLRYFLVVMWKQASDFHDDDSVRAGESQDLHHLPDTTLAGGEMDWHVDIKVTDPSRNWKERRLADPEIESYLLGLTTAEASNVTVGFALTITKGGVTSDGLKAWVDTIGRIGDMVTVWQNRLAVSQAMSSYVQGISSLRYRDDLGYLQVRMGDAYIKSTVKISSHDGNGFTWFDGRIERRVDRSQNFVFNRSDAPYGIYVQPGKYDVEILDHVPVSETGWTKRTVNVYEYYSPLFCSATLTISPKPKPIFFTIDDRLNGTVDLSIVSKDGAGNLKGTLFAHRIFNMTTVPYGKLYIDESWIPGFNFDHSAGGESQAMKDSLKLKIYITIGMDNNTDGKFERRETIEIPTSSIRNDHVLVMLGEQAKLVDQLEYRLVIYNTLQKRTYPGIEGNFNVTRYTYWDTITQF